MAEQRGLDDYGSPILRMAVFRRLNPGAQVEFSVVPIGTAFPLGHLDYEGKATEAVKCEIIFPDGSYIVAYKEIDKVERGKPVAQTPEQLAKDETKCLGRALRTAGIPQRLSELKLLMQWATSLNGDVPRQTSYPQVANTSSVMALAEEAFPGSTVEDEADAGADEPTIEQVVAKRFAFLDGPDKAHVVAYARNELGCSNVMRAGDKAEALFEYIDKRAWALAVTADAVAEAAGVTDEMRAAAEATDAKRERQRYENPPLPDEEPFLSIGDMNRLGDNYRNQEAP